MSEVLLPKELKKEMDRFPGINWSVVAREAIEKKIVLLKKMDRLFSKSELSEEDTVAHGKKISKKLSKAYEG
ncbi:MAG: hypothetical protein ACE5PM_03575 [Candidatus Hydrothermarchaeales archaeon]